MSKEIFSLVNEYFKIDKDVDSIEVKSRELYLERNNLQIKKEQLFQEIKNVLLNSNGILYLDKEDDRHAVIISKANNEIQLKKLLTADEIDTKRIFNKLEGIQT